MPDPRWLRHLGPCPWQRVVRPPPEGCPVLPPPPTPPQGDLVLPPFPPAGTPGADLPPQGDLVLRPPPRRDTWCCAPPSRQGRPVLTPSPTPPAGTPGAGCRQQSVYQQEGDGNTARALGPQARGGLMFMVHGSVQSQSQSAQLARPAGRGGLPSRFSSKLSSAQSSAAFPAWASEPGGAPAAGRVGHLHPGL